MTVSTGVKHNLVAGEWYFVQDMSCPARPAFWDGSVFRNYQGETGVGLCWHWPTFRVISLIIKPTDGDIRAQKIREDGGARST